MPSTSGQPPHHLLYYS